MKPKSQADFILTLNFKSEISNIKHQTSNIKHQTSTKNIEDLIELVATLRDQCPWDQKQTPRTMAVYLLEEVYELVEAIETGSPEAVCEELGDVFFHVFFIARLFQEMELFNIKDVAQGITEKMIHRHPHVFGDSTVNSMEEVRQQWREIKRKEKKAVQQESSVLDSVPDNLPALMRAYRISERAAGTGFDWDDISGVMEKVEEEWAELKSELDGNGDRKNQDRVALEFGDVLFTLVNVARFAKIHPETALTGSIKKFVKRFKYMERAVSETGRPIDAASPDEMETLWETAKKEVDRR
ncbi:nucleoside triphosphate pyrophosphohydrolase [Desulfobacterales bacterium HSG2]|nr:nucleoside triphosphate pyrophosphohydrolase [Desulfobacterales bacterium HSG2]